MFGPQSMGLPLLARTRVLHTHWRWANLWNGTAHAELQGMNVPPGQESVWCISLAGMGKDTYAQILAYMWISSYSFIELFMLSVPGEL